MKFYLIVTLLEGQATVQPTASSIVLICDVGLHKYAVGFLATSTQTLIALGPRRR